MPKQDKPFGVNLCTICDKPALTVGDQKFGGVRWCKECMQKSLGWYQMSDKQRYALLALFDRLEQTAQVQKTLAGVRALPEGERMAMSIGEARRRLMMAEAAERR